MEVDVIEFLEGFTLDELLDRGILITHGVADHYLRAPSVDPLLELMKERGVSKLIAPTRRWFLTSEGDFRNPLSGEIKEGQVNDLQNRGNVFNQQNTFINPYSPRFKGNAEEEPGQTEGNGFGLERDLQTALRDNIEQLEPGLIIVDGGTEKSVATGRIDITAKDSQGNFVVIELKAGVAQDPALTQLLGYMGSMEPVENGQIRGILVAQDFTDRLVYAAKMVPHVNLKAYSFRFAFEDR